MLLSWTQDVSKTAAILFAVYHHHQSLLFSATSRVLLALQSVMFFAQPLACHSVSQCASLPPASLIMTATGHITTCFPV